MGNDSHTSEHSSVWIETWLQCCVHNADMDQYTVVAAALCLNMMHSEKET